MSDLTPALTIGPNDALTIGQTIAFNVTLLMGMAAPGPALLRIKLSADRTAAVKAALGLRLLPER